MNRAVWWLIPLVLATLAIGGVAGALIAERHDGDDTVRVVTTTSDQPGEPAQVVAIDGDGRWRHGGFFPGFFLFPLLWIALIVLVIGAFWRRGGGGPGDGRMDDWHRRQHENAGPANPSGPATT